MNELTPTERLALQIQDLSAQLQLKDEELFFARAANARFQAVLVRLRDEALAGGYLNVEMLINDALTAKGGRP